jgi:hypothetical protein
MVVFVVIFGPGPDADGLGARLAAAEGEAATEAVGEELAAGDAEALEEAEGLGDALGTGRTAFAADAPRWCIAASARATDAAPAEPDGAGDGAGPGVPSAIVTPKPPSSGSGISESFGPTYTAPSSTRSRLCADAPPPPCGPAGWP